MHHIAIQKISFKLPLFLALAGASLFLFACSFTGPTLPKEAREALVDYWQSSPSEPGVEHEIIRAWPSLVAAKDLPLEMPAGEIWCVEAAISSSDDPSIDGEKLIWIVIKENEATPWRATLLAVMSATWPYEACGQAL